MPWRYSAEAYSTTANHSRAMKSSGTGEQQVVLVINTEVTGKLGAADEAPHVCLSQVSYKYYR